MAGYLGSRPVVVQVDGYQREESESRYVNVSGDDFSGHLDFVDDAKARFGSSDELHIYTESSGSGHSYIQGDNIVIRSAAGTARLTVTSNDVDVSSGALKIGGTTVINSSRVGNFNTGTVIGTYTTAPSGNPGQLAISRTGSAPYVSWHHEDGTRLGNIQFANASSTLYLSNEMSNGKWNFWNGTTTAATIDHNGAAYFGGTTQASATRFIHTGGIKFSNGASTGGEFLSWDNEGATGNQSLIGYWYDGSSYRNRFRIAGDHGETVVNGSGDDVDFRVQSDSNTHMLFVDAANNRIGINASSPQKTLEVVGDIQLDATDASLFLKSGATGTSGYVNWTFNTDATVFAKAGIEYDSRSTVGFHLDSGYPISLDAVMTSTRGLDILNAGSLLHRINTVESVFNENSLNHDFRVESVDHEEAIFVDASANHVIIGGSSANITNALAYFGNVHTGSQHFALGHTAVSSTAAVQYINRQSSDGVAIEFRRVNLPVGTISLATSGTTYNTTSDRRLKTDIQPIDGATDTLMAMAPVTHKWKAHPSAPAVHGFIAQDMQALVPEAVSGDPDSDEMMSMDYGRITPVLVAALQDAHKKIEALEERLAEMEAM